MRPPPAKFQGNILPALPRRPGCQNGRENGDESRAERLPLLLLLLLLLALLMLVLVLVLVLLLLLLLHPEDNYSNKKRHKEPKVEATCNRIFL